LSAMAAVLSVAKVVQGGVPSAGFEPALHSF
jgi:hypothetical protein